MNNLKAHEIIQKIMYEKIKSNTLSVRDFCDDYFVDENGVQRYRDPFDLIALELKHLLKDKYDYIEEEIELIDILKVVNNLESENLLSNFDLYDSSLYIANNLNLPLMEKPEYITAYVSLMNKLLKKINFYDAKIKSYKNYSKLEKEMVDVDNRHALAIDCKTRLQANRKHIKVSLAELEKIRFNLPLNTRKNKKTLLFKKNLKRNGQEYLIEQPQILDEESMRSHKYLRHLADIIDSNQATDAEITDLIFNVISSIDKKDGQIRKDVLFVINKLKERLKGTNLNIKKINNEIKNLEKLKDEFDYLEIIDEDVFEQYKENKRMLKSAYSLLELSKENIELTPAKLKAAIRSGRSTAQHKNLNAACDSVTTMKKHYFDEDLGDRDFAYGLGSYSEQKLYVLSGLASETFHFYEPESTIKDVFLYRDKYGKVRNHNWAFSIDMEDDKTTITMHVLNISPYIGQEISEFWTTDFYKSFDANFQREILMNEYIQQELSFAKGKKYPTVAYSFTFDKNYRLDKFNIDKKDVIVRDMNKDDETVINNIYDMNNQGETYNRPDAFFERLLKEKFIEYANEIKLPMIYYGKYIDETYGKYKDGIKIGYEKMDDRLEKLSDLLEDYDRKTFNNVCWRWYKNYKMKHFSLEYNEDYVYLMDDLGILKPASFMGHNLQKVINKVILEKNYNYKSTENNILKEKQQKTVSLFNKACGFIELDDFINIIADEVLQVEDHKRRF